MAVIVGVPGNNPLLQGTVEQDYIYGNSLGNITGTAGSDRIFGLGGDDRIAGDGVNILAGGRGGNDLIQGGAGDDWIWGDAYDAQNDDDGTLYGIGGNDVIYQNDGSGYLVGDANEMEAGSRGGNDKLYGGGYLIGDSYGDMTNAVGGNDLLDARSATEAAYTLTGETYYSMYGNSIGGKDTVQGSNYDDDIYGEADDDMYNASKGGNDRLLGNGGDDDIYGEADSMNDATVGGNVRAAWWCRQRRALRRCRLPLRLCQGRQ